MARLIIASVLLASSAIAFATDDAAAADPSETTHDVASVAGVDEQDLQGAVNATELDPRTYLIAVGEWPGVVPLVAVPPPPAVPASVRARVACIEAKESGGANVPNARGSGAGGVLQYLEPTFRAHAAEMGHPEWSRWNPEQARSVAAHDLQLGRRAQWSVGGC